MNLSIGFGRRKPVFFPACEWMAGTTESAIVAILSKLLRNKSWNTTVQGHAWTKEEDLLTQSPVLRDDRPKVAIEARRILPTLVDRLLLTKGSGQGNTPKEWSIDRRFLAAVKRAMISKSLVALREFECLHGLLDRIAEDQEKTYRLDLEIVTDKVRSVCRERGLSRSCLCPVSENQPAGRGPAIFCGRLPDLGWRIVVSPVRCP